MARPIKTGLDYFSFDVDFFDDDKIQLISAEFGIKGEIIAIKLLCKIYKNGYYYSWGQDESLLFSSKNGYDNNLVNEVVKRLIKRSFFNEGVFNTHQILTSRGIQRRFFEAKTRAKEVFIFQEYLLIDINEYNKSINVNINSINDNISTQRKEKESKVKQSKGVGTYVPGFTPPSFDDVLFFFKDKMPETNWTFDKCKIEAKNFIFYYAKTNWTIKNGKITDWNNAANGWIANDDKFKKQESGKNGKKVDFPDDYDRKFEASLDINLVNKYHQHLVRIGFVPIRANEGYIANWKKK